MTNEEAKSLYLEAVARFKASAYPDALAMLDRVDAARPNSRNVTLQRGLCFAAMGRLDDAEACAGRLTSKEGEAQLKALREAIDTKRASMPAAPASTTNGDASDAGNALLVETVHPVSTTETSVVGHVTSGVLRTGDTVTVVSPLGLPLMAPILRLGPAETPVNLIRAGQKAVVLLQVEPQHVVPGSTLSGEADTNAYAATMVVDTANPELAGLYEAVPAIVDAERLLKSGMVREAREVLEKLVETEPKLAAAHRLLARAYLDGPEDQRMPQAALERVREAYELGGASDPLVVDTLAEALAANGEAAHGLRFLERLFSSTSGVEARIALAQRIGDFRRANGLGDVWEFADKYGDVVFEAASIADVVKALARGTLAKDAKCRKNRVGEWRSIEAALAPNHPEVAKLFAAKGGNRRLQAVTTFGIFVAAAAVAAAIYFAINPLTPPGEVVPTDDAAPALEIEAPAE